MPEFSCRVATPTGEVFEKNYVAVDERALRNELDAQDLKIAAEILHAMVELRALRLQRGAPKILLATIATAGPTSTTTSRKVFHTVSTSTISPTAMGAIAAASTTNRTRVAGIGVVVGPTSLPR